MAKLSLSKINTGLETASLVSQVASPLLGLKKQGAHMEAMEAHQDRTNEINSGINNSLDRLSKMSNSYTKAIASQKSYSGKQSVMKNLGGLAQDLGRAAWKRKTPFLIAAGTAAGTVGASYLSDKYIQKRKKKAGIELDTLSLEETGRPDMERFRGLKKSNNKPSKEASEKKFSGDGRPDGFFKKNLKKIGGKFAKNASSIWSMTGGSLIEAGKYHWDEAELKDAQAVKNALNKKYREAIEEEDSKKGKKPTQKNYTDSVLLPIYEERMFGFIGRQVQAAKNLGKSAVKKVKTEARKAKAAPLAWGLDKASNSKGGGGHKGAKNLAKELTNSKSGSEYTKKLGTFINDHRKLVMAASIPAAAYAFKKAIDLGKKGTEKALKKVDKNAWANRDAQAKEREELARKREEYGED